MNLTFIWEDITKISGVGTWIVQAMLGLEKLGVHASLLDIAQTRLGHDDRSEIRDRVVELSRPDGCSEYQWRRLIRKNLEALDTDLVAFHDHRHVEDVLDSLPEGFPAMNVLHLDRPDEAYDHRTRDLAERVRAFPAVSQTVRDRAAEIVGDKARFLPLGIEVPVRWKGERSVSQPLRAMFVGRVVEEQKRILDLAAFARSAGDAVQIDVYGDGSAMRELREAVPGNVTLHGAVAHEDVLAAMEEADVLLLFSEYEGLPLVLLEACARGVVPLVTDIRSGIGDLLSHGENALLFPVGEPETAAGLLAQSWDWSALRMGARTVGETYSFSTCLSAYAAWMQDLATPHVELAGPMSLRLSGLSWLRDRMPIRDSKEKWT